MQIATVEHKLTSMHYTLHSFKAADMFNFWLSKQGDFSISFLPLPSCSNHIFIESLSGVGKAKKEIMMVPMRNVLLPNFSIFPSFCIQTSLLIRLSDFFLPDIPICKHLKTFPSQAVSFSQQMQADAANESTTTLRYQMWVLGLGYLALTNGNSYITLSAMSICMCLEEKTIFKILFHLQH